MLLDIIPCPHPREVVPMRTILPSQCSSYLPIYNPVTPKKIPVTATCELDIKIHQHSVAVLAIHLASGLHQIVSTATCSTCTKSDLTPMCLAYELESTDASITSQTHSLFAFLNLRFNLLIRNSSSTWKGQTLFDDDQILRAQDL